MLLSLSACALWSDFEPQKPEVPEKWKVEAGEKGQWPDEQWWNAFKSENLSKQIERANRDNFDMSAAVARVQQADAQARINGASLLPAITASGELDRSQQAGLRAVNTGGSRTFITNFAVGNVAASYELDFWGKNKATAASAEALAKASRFDQQTIKLTTLSSVANNYFDILGTKERLKVARENLSNAQALMDTIQKRYKVGVATQLDLAQQESVVAKQLATIPPLEQRLQQSLNAQAILLATLPENMKLPEEELKDITIPEIASGIPSELLQRRPDVQNAEAQLESAHADIIVARTAFFPSISLTGSGGTQSRELSQLFQADSILWSVGTSFTQPIFQGGRLFGQLDLQKARYEELLANYRKTVVSAFSDVENALIAVKQTAAGEAAQQQAVKTARNAYKLTRQQLEGGIIDIITVLNTQTTLFSAEDALVQSRILHLQAAVSLYKALGGGWVISGKKP